MNEKIKKQLTISIIMIGLLIGTLVLWYDNFSFHTYMNKVDYQLCLEGENDDILIQGYEAYQDKNDQNHGGARIAAKKENLFQEDDLMKITFILADSKEEDKQFIDEYKIKSDNEVFYIDTKKTTGNLSAEDFKSASINITITRNKKEVYNDSISLYEKTLVLYNGGNKDYTIQNSYVSNTWMKTGHFSSTKKNISETYPYMTIDYLFLKADGNSENIDDYERFIHIKGKTQDFLDGKVAQSIIYDGKDSLIDKKIVCVIALSENEKLENPYTFKIDIYGNIKAGD